MPRVDGRNASALDGRVVWAPTKSLWNLTMLSLTVVAAPASLRADTLVLFAISTYISLLAGHSVGMHRGLIHRSYRCSKWLERALIYIGVLVGMAGPYGVIRIHDIRDWAQRARESHDFFAHRRSIWIDAFWQLNCRFELARPPKLTIEPELADDVWYRWMDRTWMLQQVPVALVLFPIGGWGWVVWGVCARVAVSNLGHWIVTYHAHRPGAGRWHVRGASVQASNLEGLGFITLGECWHNNHHAFPESARIGLETGQTDPGWWVLKTLERLGLVWDLGLPEDASKRSELVPATSGQEVSA